MVGKTFLRRAAIGQVRNNLGQTGFSLSRKTAKDNHQTTALISHDLTQNNELAFSSTSNLQFYRFQTLKFFFLDFGFGRTDMNDILKKSDVKSRRQDQSIRHS